MGKLGFPGWLEGVMLQAYGQAVYQSGAIRRSGLVSVADETYILHRADHVKEGLYLLRRDEENRGTARFGGAGN